MIRRINEIAHKEGVRQLFKYGLVGMGGLLIELVVFYLLTKKFLVEYPISPYISTLLEGKMSVHVIDTDISHVISSVLAIINNFILNSYFTFKVTDKKLKRFLSFIGVAAIGLIISTTLMTVFIGRFNMDEMLSKGLALLIVVSVQFVINKFFTFKQQNKEELV